MQSYQAFELPHLIELLSEKTELFTKMLTSGDAKEEEFKACQSIVEQLQSEIKARSTGNSTVSETDMHFTQ